MVENAGKTDVVVRKVSAAKDARKGKISLLV